MAASAEFIIKVIDQASAAFNKIKNEVGLTQGAYDRANQALQAHQRTINGTATSIGNLKQRIDQLNARRDLLPASATAQIRAINSEVKKLNAEMGRLQTMNGSKVKTWAADAFNQIPGAGLLKNPLVMGGAALAGIVSAGAKAEQQKVGMETYLGKTGAQKAYKNIQSDAAATPFDTDSLLSVNMALLSTGMSAEKARNDAMNLANAIAASGKGNDELQRMAANMQQIKNLGKASATDIKQFGMAGINIYGVLAQSVYKTKNVTEQQIASVQEMDITYEQLSKAFEAAAAKGGAFEGALDRMSKTTGARWNSLIDNIGIKAAQIGEQLQPIINAVLKVAEVIVEYASVAIEKLINGFRMVAHWVKENISWLGMLAAAIAAGYAAYQIYNLWQTITYMWMMRQVIAESLLATWTGIVTLVTGGFTGAMTLLNAVMTANPIGLIIVAIGALVGAIVWAWNTFEGFRGFLYGLWESFKQVFMNIGGFFKKIFEPIFEAIAAFKEGRYLDAAKAVGKMALNLSPVGLAITAVNYAREGGFTKGVAEKYKSGYNEGVKAFRAGKEAEKTEEAASTLAAPAGISAASVSASAGGTSSETSTSGVTGGGPRVITINLQRLVDKIELHAATLTEGLGEVEYKIEEMFLRVLNSGAKVQA